MVHGDAVVELEEAQLGVHLVDLALEVGPEVGLDLADLLEELPRHRAQAAVELVSPLKGRCAQRRPHRRRRDRAAAGPAEEPAGFTVAEPPALGRHVGEADRDVHGDHVVAGLHVHHLDEGRQHLGWERREHRAHEPRADDEPTARARLDAGDQAERELLSRSRRHAELSVSAPAAAA